jgi:hypothetical protein
MQPEARKLLTDIEQPARSIVQFAQGKTLNDLQQDEVPVLLADVEQLLRP